LGGVLLTPLSAYWINDWGLFATMPVLGVMFTLCILPLAIWVVRPAPVANVSATNAEFDDWSYGAAIRTRFYVLLALGYVLCMGAQVGGIAHLYSRVDEIAGFVEAARAVQILTVCSIVGRLVGGFVVAYVAIRWFTLGNLIVQMIGLMTLATAESAAAAWVGAGLFGASVGNLLMLQPLWLAQAFPGVVYARVFALANALSVIGVAFGPYLMGVAFDLDGYLAAYIGAALVSVVAWFIVWRAGDGPVRLGLRETRYG
jgi:predicted MFS family arabinose efflux permease